jgi:hypothetical protein
MSIAVLVAEAVALSIAVPLSSAPDPARLREFTASG